MVSAPGRSHRHTTLYRPCACEPNCGMGRAKSLAEASTVQ